MIGFIAETEAPSVYLGQSAPGLRLRAGNQRFVHSLSGDLFE